MTALSKLCDAGDWFDPAFDRIIREELEERPRLHRKQWEFAQIFRSLASCGLITGSARGLSMGGGGERLLYAVARRVAHLTVTDLYAGDSVWAGARTDDPERWLLTAAPFPVDGARLAARRMDMRALAFDDASFDFCYSSCAIEHIGARADFLAHLAEVRRVLKDGGVYVLTTEFTFGDAVIEAPHNYYFTAPYLDALFSEAGFAVSEGGVDGRLWPHSLNLPLPARLRDLLDHPDGGLWGAIAGSVPHVQLLTGGVPFTSLNAVLVKAEPGTESGLLPMRGLDEARRFVEAGADDWRALVERSVLSLDPSGLNGEEPSRRDAPPLVACEGADDTLFHTGYVWLGERPRTVAVDVGLCPAGAADAAVEIRLHRQPTLHPEDVAPVGVHALSVTRGERRRVVLPLAPDAACSYAVVGKVTKGSCSVDAPVITTAPAS